MAALVTAIGAILMGTSFQFGQFVVSRIVVGLGQGGIIATTSVWQGELSKAESRGAHVSNFGIAAGIGLVFALWIDFGCSYVSNSFAWRFPFLFQIVFEGIIMAFIFTFPESPRWLVKKGRIAEARDVFSRIHDVGLDDDIVNNEIRDVQASLELAQSVSLSAMFKMGPQRTFHRVILAATIQMFLQMTGVNSVTSYANVIFEEQLRFTTKIAAILGASSQVVIILGSLIGSLTVDRFGRRRLMLTSAASMSVCQVCLTGLTSQPDNSAALKAAVFFIFFYYFVYSQGFLGVPFLYASEIAPVHLRAATCGVSTAVSWLFNFLVVEVTPIAFNNIGYRYFIVYAVVNAVCVAVVYFFYPETAGRTLEEIDEIFAKSNGVFDPVKVAKSLPKGRLQQFLEDDKLDGATIYEIENQHKKSVSTV